MVFGMWRCFATATAHIIAGALVKRHCDAIPGLGQTHWSQLLGVDCDVSGAVPEPPSTCQVEAMSGLWEAQLVVAACALPEPLVAALLRAGAKAVVCCRAPSEDPVGSLEPSAEAAIAFFEVRALTGRC